MGYLSGEIEVGFFLIFPFLIGSGVYAFLGFIFVFIAVLVLMFGFVSRFNIIHEGIGLEEEQLPSQNKTTVKGGGVILIGPIPIVFGSNWKIAVILMIFAIVLIVIGFLTINTNIGL
jgi:uncharacterized protein (TIGR00304 family)